MVNKATTNDNISDFVKVNKFNLKPIWLIPDFSMERCGEFLILWYIGVRKICTFISVLYFTNLQNGHYKTLGMYAGMSAIQGGCGFPILHSVVFEYLNSEWAVVR